MSVDSKRALVVNGKKLEVEPGATFGKAAQALGVGKIALAGRALGRSYTLDDKIPEGASEAEILTKERGGLAVLRHSASHLMASAIKRLWPEARFGTGPDTEKGFYYDVDLAHRISDEDLRKIEAEMKKIVSEDAKFERSELSREEAEKLVLSKNESFKQELIRDHAAGGETVFSFYKHSDFVDYCEGPHVPSTAWIKAVKLHDVSGSYWRGKEGNPQLQRVRGTAFFSEKDLQQHEKNIEEAKNRDHRKLGQQLDLFSFNDFAPGIPFFHPRGVTVYNELLAFLRDEYRKRGYVEVRAPLVLKVDLWHRSGHYANYRENMFFTQSEDVEMAVKPMNCPGHCLIFKERPRSYRDLPIRMAEFSPLHRNERSGTLHGLMRVRGFSQDDAHIFCREDQLEQEVLHCIAFLKKVYDTFGFKDVKVELSTRPEKSIGTKELWQKAEGALENALNKAGLNFRINAGDGAFYGPKIDFHITDALDRSWQCGTLQLDYNLPSGPEYSSQGGGGGESPASKEANSRFDLSYKGQDNQPHRPVMIHRALLGSLERMIGVLIEHWAGAFPLWLAPEQARVLPVAEAFVSYAREVEKALFDAGLRASVDDSPEKVGKRVRDAVLAKVPYVLVVGEKEAQARSVTVRARSSEKQVVLSLSSLIERARGEVARRELAPEASTTSLDAAAAPSS
ncbi:threonine--tRNA ligase [bacterium]|nr:threonine--tRNA ligase [bacterium]